MALRCSDCGILLKRASNKGRTPKYCVPCRQKQQESYKKRSK